MHEQFEKPVDFQKQTLALNSFFVKNENFPREELNIFDCVVLMQRNWKIIVSVFLLGISISMVFVYKISTTGKIVIPIEMPTAKALSSFALPQISVGDEGVLILPATPLVERAELQRILKAASIPAFGATDGSINVALEVFESTSMSETAKERAANVVVTVTSSKAHSYLEKIPSVVQQVIDSVQLAVQDNVKKKLETRFNQIEDVKIRLRESTLRNIRNRFAIRERELGIKKNFIRTKIKAAEYETQLKRENERQNELQALEEKRQAQRFAIERELQALHQLATSRRQDRIETLKEAAKTAEQLGIEDFDGRNLVGVHSAFVHQNSLKSNVGGAEALIYLRGKRALLAEVKQLEEQSNDSLLVPEIRELEQGLKLIENDSRYLALKARKQDRLFSPEVPALLTQLKLLENDEELESLRATLNNPDSIEFYVKDFQVLKADSLRAERMLQQVLTGYNFVAYDNPSLPKAAAQSATVIAVGALLALLLSCVLVFLFEGWKAFTKSKKTSFFNAEAGSDRHT